MDNNNKRQKNAARDPFGRGLGSKSYVYTLLSITGVLAFFLIWQLLVEAGLLEQRYLEKPTKIIALFFSKLTVKEPDGATLLQHIWASLSVSLTGLFMAIVVGLPLGSLMGWYKGLDKFMRPIFEIVRPIPPVSWIPLTILWLGIGLQAKAFVIFFAAFIPCVINSYTGVKMTRQSLINVAKTCGCSKFEIFRKVCIPSALPMMFAGIRVALGNAWATLVAAEMLASTAGLGYMITMGRNFARPDLIVLGMCTIGGIGAIFNGVFSVIEKNVIKWRVGA